MLPQWEKEHKPSNGGWRVSCDDEQSAHLQHWRPDHCHPNTGRPNVFDCKKKKLCIATGMCLRNAQYWKPITDYHLTGFELLQTTTNLPKN